MRLKCVGKNAYIAFYGKQKHYGTLRECLLFSMGFGADQAAELRRLMRRLSK